MFATVPSLFVSTVIGSCARPLGKRPLLELGDRAPHGRCVHVRCLDDDVGRQRRAGERLLHAVVGLHDVQATCGKVSGPGVDDAQLERRRREQRAAARPRARRTAAAGAGRGRRSRPQTRPSPSSPRSRPTSGTRSRSTPSPSLESSAGRTVSEPSIATATTIIVARPKDAKVPVAGQEHRRPSPPSRSGRR